MKVSVLWLAVVCAACVQTYPYRIVNEQCNCVQYRSQDPHRAVRYTFTAEYSVNSAIASKIEVIISNDTRDTLDLTYAYVKVSSKNVPYRYNDKFLPVHVPAVLPLSSQTLTLAGESRSSDDGDPWLSVAGEELVVTLKGLRFGESELTQQVVRFVPENPRLSVQRRGT